LPQQITSLILAVVALTPQIGSARNGICAALRRGPNVVLVITDDQGYGELSCHGNPVLRTPNLDQLYRESVRFTDFHAAPMCTPTRGQLMTGIVALRNGAINVSSGRTLLRRGFPTLAELFAASGYRTGLFGKWHLGDTYPFRPQDPGCLTMIANIDENTGRWDDWPSQAGLRDNTLQTEFRDASGAEIGGAYYVTAERLPADRAEPVKLILDTDMSGDADDAGTLALLHALADLGECELLATVVNRKDLSNASAAAVDAINTWHGRPDLPIGTDKAGPTALQRTSLYTAGLRDGFPHDIGPDDRAPDAFDVYRQVLAAQPDGSVAICSVGALSNLAELVRREPDLVRAKVRRLVVMGGQFPPQEKKPETNIATHVEAARVVAAQWPTEIVWQGFEVGHGVITGAALKQTPAGNPVRRAYELRLFAGRPSIQGGQPSYDQAAALFAVRGPDPELWHRSSGGRVAIDEQGLTRWIPDASGRHVLVSRACSPARLAEVIESLMIRPPEKTPVPCRQ